MEKEIRPYKQRGDTCMIACMLMVLEYYHIIPKINGIYERKYNRVYHSHYLTGTPLSAIAWHFSKNDLEVQLIHSESNYFTNHNNFLSDKLFELTLEEYKEYVKDANRVGAVISKGVDITIDLLKEKLNDHYFILLAGQVHSFLHTILICEYENNFFAVCDPLYREIQSKSDKEINEFMHTSIGKWCLLVREKSH